PRHPHPKNPAAMTNEHHPGRSHIRRKNVSSLPQDDPTAEIHDTTPPALTAAHQNALERTPAPAAPNPRAQHAYEKAGFVAEGVERQTLWQDGEWIDTVRMSVLAPEWAAHQGRPDRGRG
ncbi:GNAT family protein, partial [Streptomyces europaeiscabiei]|nr:GNAT family protein [Streptomyces europaeiscabiei]